MGHDGAIHVLSIFHPQLLTLFDLMDLPYIDTIDEDVLPQQFLELQDIPLKIEHENSILKYIGKP